MMGESVEEGLVALDIGNARVLWCELIFDEWSYVYDAGEVKRKLDKWFKDKKEEEDD